MRLIIESDGTLRGMYVQAVSIADYANNFCITPAFYLILISPNIH
jgi:hypothetical protein